MISLASRADPAAGPIADRPTFESLVADYHPSIFRFLLRLCAGRQHDAEDLCQDTFLRAYRAYPTLDARGQERAWLYRIAYNVFLNDRRRSRPTVPATDEIAATGHDDVGRELVRAVAAFIQTLPPKQRAALVLRRIDGREYAEIAAVLGGSEEAARANVFQALKKVRERFAEEYQTQ